ncbi:DNA mismatch repair endonuclease MutL [Selenomonas sp. TAMA-11512]|nr:DNA mismatch repair endonuclease MutL [Selenomonas sp. TAMA-11512]
MRISVLDDATINKIAAGEVVERPASVIKELIENALDAQATKIEIEIAAGGTSLMRVTDDGIGMSKEDAVLAIRRHATSKIKAAADIYELSTLGFRGEALPTIASVSRFSLRTREHDAELGTEITILGGKAPEIAEAGCSIGTRIQVEDLFFNTPARKKFLKTTHTEGAKISDFVTKLSLANPEIAFRFINNNKVSLITPGNGSVFDVIQSVYGKEAADSLLVLNFEDENIRITGYITKPNMLRSSRSWQTFIVNERVISSKAIAKAIDNAYHSMVPKTGFPMVLLKIEVPQRSIDVNVHPQKTEIKFEDESRIFKAVYKAVVDAVRPEEQRLGDVAAGVQSPARHYVAGAMQFQPADAQPILVQEPVRGIPERPDAYSLDFVTAQNTLHENRGQDYLVPERMGAAAEEAHTSAAEPTSSTDEQEGVYAGEVYPIGQVDKCYIIAQDDTGLYLIDQHAAHERILYDRFAKRTTEIPSQQLLVHQLLSFDSDEAELVEQHLDTFRALGFDMMASGAQEFRLREVPADIQGNEAADAVREILTLVHANHRVSAEEIRHACLATTACRAAIKSGEVLNLKQMKLLLEELAHTDRPYTCPHGRPTILKFSSDELAKMFKRT